MQAYFNRTSPFIFKTLGEIRSNHLTPKNKLAQKELVQKSTKLKMTKCSFLASRTIFASLPNGQ